jgi:hypothetical protein
MGTVLICIVVVWVFSVLALLVFGLLKELYDQYKLESYYSDDWRDAVLATVNLLLMLPVAGMMFLCFYVIYMFGAILIRQLL